MSLSSLTLCSDPANELVLSIASVWEMQIKEQLGKLSLRLPLADLIRDQQDTNDIRLLDISLPHVLGLSALPMYHKDPFDRLIAAQAIAEGISLLSADPMFALYPVALLT
jgi:PIN domain nuclease of toxin-antitoxin system